MNICLIGDSLTSLALAKNLINKNIKVFVYYKNTKNSKFQSRTIGISKKKILGPKGILIEIRKKIYFKAISFGEPIKGYHPCHTN